MKMKEIIDAMGGPTILVFVGALLSAVGAVWAGIDQNKNSRKLDEKNEEIARLSREIANSVTGGPTVCYLAPMGGSPNIVTLVSSGDFPLYDVSVRIVDLELFEAKKNEPFTLDSIRKNEVSLDLGGMPPKSARILGPLLQLSGETRRWNIFFSARNGFFTQLLRMKKVDGVWKSAIRVTRDTGKGSEVAFEQITDGYPRGADGAVDWK